MAPIIYSRSESGLVPSGSYNSGVLIDSDKFGPLGEIQYVTIHHTAGPRAPDKATAQRLHKTYQYEHAAKGWGDIGYHFGMDDLGRVYRLRNHAYKGTHVGDWNSRNIGIMVHGNYEFNNLTDAQNDSLRWLFQGGFYALFGEPEAGLSLVRGHQEWPGHASNACPGRALMRHLDYLRNTETF